MKGHAMTRPNLASWLPVVAFLTISPATLAADLYKIDPEHTSVIFSAAHTGLSYTYGMFRDVSGIYQIDKANPANSAFKMTIRADSLDTNNAERDKHLRSPDFFDVQQFQEITFESTRCEFIDTPESGGKAFRLMGTLTIHGVPRQVPLILRMFGEGAGASGKDHRTGFHTQLEIDRTDFKMNSLVEKNLVGKAVGITVSFEGVLQAPPAGVQPTR
jgi:polyisoprenoid-binding protein YceI